MQLTVKLVLKEWQFSDGSHSLHGIRLSSRQSLYGSSNFLPGTGRKICITVVEGKDLMVKGKFGKSDPYVKLQYGKVNLYFIEVQNLLRKRLINLFFTMPIMNLPSDAYVRIISIYRN